MRQRTKHLILFGCLGAILIVGGFLFLRSPYVLNWARITLESELQKRLNHSVSIDNISGDVLAGLNIKGINIAAPGPENPPLISLDEIRIRYRLWDLARGEILITQLYFHRPQVNLRWETDGTLNISKLMPKNPSKTNANFPLQLLISNINIKDIGIENGIINFEDEDSSFKAAIGGIYSHSRVDGPLHSWRCRGRLEVRDGRFELNNIETQIDEFKTEFALQDNRGRLQSLHLALGNSLLTIAGEASNFDEQTPQISTQIQMTLDLRDVQKILASPAELAGVAEVDVEASGPMSEIVGKFGITLPSVRLNDFQFEDFIVQAEFTPSSVRIDNLDTQFASGKIIGAAEVNLHPEQENLPRLGYEGWVQFDSLQAEQLLPIVNFPKDFLDAKASLNGRIQFSAHDLNLRNINLDGDLELSDPSLNGVPIRPSQARYQLKDKRLSITGNLDEAQIDINGNPGFTDSHNMDLRITKINMGKLAQILQLPEIAGEGTLTGKSSAGIGDEAGYALNGFFSVPEATLYDVPIGALTTDFRYSENQVFLNSIRLVKGQSELVANGVAHVDGDIPVEIKVHAQPLQIADYVRLAGADYPIEGIVIGELVLDGTLARLDGRGALRITDGKAWDLALDPLTLPIKIENYLVKIPDFELLTRGQRGLLNAQIDPDQNYIIDFQTEPMRLAELAIARGMTDFLLDADLIVTAKGEANAADPHADVVFEFSDVTYAGHALEDVYITGVYRDNALIFEGIAFNDTCQIRGVLESSEGSPYQVFVEGMGIDLLPFLRIFNVADYFAGTADGHVEIEGMLEDLSKFQFQMSLPKIDLDVNGRHVTNANPIRVSFADNLWHIESLVLADRRNGGAFLDAVGTFPIPIGIEAHAHEGSKITDTFGFTVESNAFPLEGLSYLFGLPPILSGNVSYRFVGSGTYKDPQLELNWDIPDVMIQTPIGQIPIRKAIGGLFYSDGSLKVESFKLFLLGNPVEVQGSVKVNLDSFPSSSLDLHASCPNFKLDSRDFQNLPDYLNDHLILFNLETQITGDLAQPELVASIDATQRTMQVFDLPTPVENLDVAFQISAGQPESADLISVKLKSANWQFDGGQYRASGVWGLPKTSPVSRLTSIIDVIEQSDLVQFQLCIKGDGVNLVTPLNYIIKRNLFNVESRTDIEFDLRGTSYHPSQISATLMCNNLHIKINNHDLHNIDDIKFHFGNRKLTLAPMRIGEGNSAWLNAGGSIDLDGNMDLYLALDRLPYGVLIPAITLILLDQSVLQFDGFLTSQIQVSGDVMNPIIAAEWESDGHIGNANLKDNGSASYQEKLLSIQNTQRIVGISKQLDISGTIPIDLAVQQIDLKDRFLDLPIDLKLRGEHISLVPLGLLFHPFIESADGIADIDLSIQGTTASPYPQGALLVKEGTLKLTNFDIPISNWQVELRADKGEIRIPTLSFQVGQGAYNASISCRLAGLIATDFEITRFVAHKARIADFVGDQSRFLNPIVSRFLNPEAIGMESIAAGLRGHITAEASLKIPVDEFLIPGKTAWVPTLIKPFNPPNVIKYVTGQLNLQDVLIEGLGYQIRNPSPIQIQLVNQKLSLENGFRLEDQKSTTDETKQLRVTGFGSWELGKKLLFHIEMQNLDLGFVSGFLPEAYAVRGSLNSWLDIRGTDAEPKISLTWQTPELRINQAEVNQFTGSIRYEDRKIRISGKQDDEVHLYIGRNHATLSGVIPFYLSLLEFRAEPLPEDIQGGLDIAVGDLDFLSLIFPQFAFTEGVGDINATVGGRLDSPVFKGSVDLTGLAFELPSSHMRGKNGFLYLDLSEKGVKIRRITGDMNGGTFQINGTIQSNWFDVQGVDLVAELSEGTMFEKPGFYQLECQKAALEMKGEVTSNGNLKLPPLRGAIRVKEGRYEQDWKQLVQDLIDKTADVQFEVWFDYPIVRDLELDLDIIAPNNLWVESNIGDVKIEAAANGELVGPVQKPIFSGRVDLLEGELSHFGHQFEVQEGSYIENKNALEFNPWYEITVETTEPIRGAQVETTDGEIRTKDVRVTVGVSGYLNEQSNPDFQAEVLRKGAGEEYDFDPSDVFAILTLGGTDPLGSEASASTRFQQYLVNQFANSQLAKAAGLSETRFDFSSDNFEESRFLLTKEFSQRLSLTYSSTFQLHTEPRIEVEYQIHRHFYIKGERNERGKYGIDLKLEQRF